MRLQELARTSAEVARTSARLEKVSRLAAVLRALGPGERRLGAAWLAGELVQGRIGLGHATVRAALEAVPAAAEPTLELADVQAALERIAAARGGGSAGERRRTLEGLLSRATAEERAFLTGLLLGELRQGALEGVLVEAVAKAAEVPAHEVRRAAMMGGALAEVAEAALGESLAGLARFRLRLLEPVSPMLASPAADVAEALDELGEAALEWKLDGARVQVHRDGDEVRVFSRTLRDVTPAVPEIVAAVKRLPVGSIVLDGEAIALRPDGTPEPFQVTMSRFGRRGRDVSGAVHPERPSTPDPLRGANARDERAETRGGPLLTALFFDLLHAGGEDLVGRTARDRAERLAAEVPATMRVPRLVTDDLDDATEFLDGALGRGHEGIVAKSLEAPYEAGRRGAAWRKVKRAHTLDLVVLAVEKGSGRRSAWLSNLHLGARDPEHGGFVMLGKTFKGMTDAMLRWQTEKLRSMALGESDGWVVHVRPELVVEIAFDGLQASTRYPGGLALRFARVKRYREDKPVEQADTIETVRRIFLAQGEREGGTDAAEEAEG
ncbi:MAG: ATP-dependent DNA ligase [Anaeromyxobacteraceae bacterium]